MWILTSKMTHSDDDFSHEIRHADIDTFALEDLGLLFDNLDFCVNFEWVVRADLGTETVLEWRDDATAVGVVLGVG